MPAKLRVLVVCLCAVAAAFVPAFAQQASPHAAAAPLAAGHTFVVDSTFDAPDADKADNICASAANGCTLRAAIDQANYQPDLDTIIVPAGIYVLTRVGNEDDNVTGDLDIKQSVIISGAGSGVTIIDGNGLVTTDGVFQILSTAMTTTMSGMTIRNGISVTGTHDTGGGILWQGGAALSLSDVRIEHSQAHNGGGLFLSYPASGGSVMLDHVSLYANYASTSGGGLEAELPNGSRGFVMLSSQVISNSAGTGGGVAIQALNGSGSLTSAQIAQSEFYSNTSAFGAGLYLNVGDASHPLYLIDSRVHDNDSSYLAGGVQSYGHLSLLRTEVERNHSVLWGGGIFNAGLLELVQSTISQNTAEDGAGIYTYRGAGSTATTYLLNSTVSGNIASHQGGGLYAAGGEVDAYNSTIAANQIILPIGRTGGIGAGIIVTGTATYPAYLTLFQTANTILADNVTFNPKVGSYADDCFGLVTSEGYTLFGTFSNCGYSHAGTGDLIGLDPKLGLLQLNGGSTPTQALLAGSPAIDAGNPAGCADLQNQPVSIDQRGVPRNDARCDIGAYEAATNVAQTIDFPPIPNQTMPGPPFGITATASSGLTVTFGTNTPGICTPSAASLNFPGVSAATVTLHNPGQCALVAQQPGDATFNSAPPVTRTFNISAMQFLPLVQR